MSKTQKKVITCPQCGKKTFERGSLLVGAGEGGPIRFELDSGSKVKVRARACSSCGYLHIHISPRDWESWRLHEVQKAIGQWALGYYPDDIRIPITELKKQLVMPKSAKDKMIKKVVETNNGKFNLRAGGDGTTPIRIKLDKTGKNLHVVW